MAAPIYHPKDDYLDSLWAFLQFTSVKFLKHSIANTCLRVARKLLPLQGDPSGYRRWVWRLLLYAKQHILDNTRYIEWYFYINHMYKNTRSSVGNRSSLARVMSTGHDSGEIKFQATMLFFPSVLGTCSCYLLVHDILQWVSTVEVTNMNIFISDLYDSYLV